MIIDQLPFTPFIHLSSQIQQDTNEPLRPTSDPTSHNKCLTYIRHPPSSLALIVDPMTGQNLFFVGSRSGNDSESLELVNLPPNPPNHSDCGMPLAESLTLNLPSSPPNHLDCGPPLSQPCLRFGEP